MSNSCIAVMTCSRAAAGRAPGWEKTSEPSLKAIKVGIDVICAAAALEQVITAVHELDIEQIRPDNDYPRSA